MQYCLENSIHYQAYSSLGTTVADKSNPLLCDEVVLDISKFMNKSPAQILLRWAIQQGIGMQTIISAQNKRAWRKIRFFILGVLPKSLNPNHIEENIKLDFVLNEKDLNRLNSLDRRCKYAWDPSMVV